MMWLTSDLSYKVALHAPCSATLLHANVFVDLLSACDCVEFSLFFSAKVRGFVRRI